jgi:hypothetical protein
MTADAVKDFLLEFVLVYHIRLAFYEHGEQSLSNLPRSMKPISSDIAVLLLKPPEGKVTASMDRKYYKNVSIYFVELPATPRNFERSIIETILK